MSDQRANQRFVFDGRCVYEWEQLGARNVGEMVAAQRPNWSGDVTYLDAALDVSQDSVSDHIILFLPARFSTTCDESQLALITVGACAASVLFLGNSQKIALVRDQEAGSCCCLILLVSLIGSA